ncbi:EIN3-binding F-box protein 1 [Abeliophyllum distichum]|uniref:EIN3-binding F-box protein 1 n=1 Tax=Abeliophyllum distichum TaxID=126358 RepID=A0ABD1V526_9LAMI
MSLAVIGYYGHEVTGLALTGLQNVNERGFWAMGNGKGLQKMKSFAVNACRGVSNVELESMGKGSLESFQIEKCHRITQFGFFGILGNSRKLKALVVENSLGIRKLK